MALNVETYQLAKNNGPNSNSTIPKDLADRVENLERNQMSIFNEFTEDFINDTYIDNVNTTAIITSDSVVPLQFSNILREDFDNDFKIDWDYTDFISCSDGKVKLLNNINPLGTLTTEFYDTPKAKSFIINVDDYLPPETSITDELDIAPSEFTWFKSGKDNFGKLWVFDADARNPLTSDNIYLTIYNPNMTIYKDRKLTDIKIPEGRKALYISIGGDIIFDHENICILSFNTVTRGILTNEPKYVSPEALGEYVISCKEDGNMIDTLHSHDWSSYYNSNLYGTTPGISPMCKFYNDEYLLITVTKTTMYYHWSTYQNLSDGAIFIKYRDGKKIDTVFNNVSMYSARHAYNGSGGNYKSVPHRPIFMKKDNAIYNIFPGDTYSNNQLSSALHYKTFKVTSGVGGSVSLQYSVASIPTTGKNILLRPPYGGRLSGVYFNEYNNDYYAFEPSTYADNATVIHIHKFSLDIEANKSTFIETKSITLNKPTTTIFNLRLHDVHFEVVNDGKYMHIFYLGSQDSSLSNSLRYICLDYDMNVIIPDSLVYCADEAKKDVYYFEAHLMNNKIMIMFNVANSDYKTLTSSGIKMAYITKYTRSHIEYYYSTDKEMAWRQFNPGELINKPVAINNIRFKSVLSTTGNLSPEINGITVQYFEMLSDTKRISEICSTRIPIAINSGKAVLSADYYLGDGTVDWYVSFNGGDTYSKVNLNEEFAYSYINSPDFRVKALLSVSDSSTNIPRINSYTLKTNSMVLHSDIEEVQINIMKTNFKLDTFMNASKNGLFKMGIEVFNDTNFLDDSKSDYKWDIPKGAIWGNYAQTKIEHIDSPIKNILITSDENLETGVNAKIEYFVSVDGGATFTSVIPNVKKGISVNNSKNAQLMFKFVFHDDAQLSAIGWAWD